MIEGDRRGFDRPGEQIQRRVKRLQVNVTIKAIFLLRLGSKRQVIELRDLFRSDPTVDRTRPPQLGGHSGVILSFFQNECWHISGDNRSARPSKVIEADRR